MSGPKRGGVAVKVLSGRTAASLQRYRDSKEDKEPPLFMATRHCSLDAETQIAEWKAVRVEHGTQGATRSPRARYETVDPDTGIHASGQRGTHIKHWDGKRHRKRLAGPGETPTHLRIEPEDALPEKESEATHSIYAFGVDLVNPENPADVERAFLAVKAERDEHYPGLQESIWGERNGESGLFHVHVASNATVYRAFELDGVEYRAGQKMGGDMRDVHSVRARFEQYLDAHPEYSFEQSLSRVGTPEYAAAQRRDGQRSYWERARAEREGMAPKENNQDRIRREAYEALQAPGVTDRDSFAAEMMNRGIAVDETGLRRGKRGKGYDLRYKVDGAKQGVKGATLGPEYAHDAIDAQLARKAKGLEVEVPAGQQRVGEPAQLPLTSTSLSAEEQAELEQLKSAIAALAQDERVRQDEEQQRALQTKERSYDGEQVTEEMRVRIARDDAAVQARFDADAQAVFDSIRQGPARNEQQPATWVPEQSVAVVPEPAQPEKPEAATFRSGLRGVKAKGGSEAVQRRLDGMAELEEDYRGELPDAEYEARLNAFGVGPHFMRHYGEHLEPETRRQLTWRVQAKAASAAERQRGQEHAERGQRLREQYDHLRVDGERSDPHGWVQRQEVLKVHNRILASDSGIEKTNGRRKEIHGLVRDGRYEEAARAAERHQEQDRKTREAMENYSSGLDHDEEPSASDRFSARAKAAQERDRDSMSR